MRESGVLMPIFSLGGDYGIGNFGKQAYAFVDFLKSSGWRYWQILPLVETGTGNSPYMSVSSTSINPLFVDPEDLFKRGLVTREDLDERKCHFYKKINYTTVRKKQMKLLRKAFGNFDVTERAFVTFKENGKYTDYALFKAISSHTKAGDDFSKWKLRVKTRTPFAMESVGKKYAKDVDFWLFVQYIAKKQWLKLKMYANDNDVKIIGDIPFYVSYASADVWANPKNFKLDDNYAPTEVAGVPPDYFSKDGQLWGNPVYDVDYQSKRGYEWWIERITKSLELYDVVRLDHFRAFDRFYSVKAGEKTAVDGEWKDSVGKSIFNKLKKIYPCDRFIAEDLGTLDDGVYALLKSTGFRGMKVISFAFDGSGDNPYLLENIKENSVCYTGTHDNDTLLGLVKSLDGELKKNHIRMVRQELDYAKITKRLNSDKAVAEGMLELALASESSLAIIPMHDLLLLDGEYRINTPGVVGDENWSVRISDKYFTEELAKKMAGYNETFNRNE